ncbi:PTS sugar transporter subunit IIA [Endozoicomonas arenosclerae]|uniref:PTS sugar transporter subunit IIA n=1 Tax=Endozoicomonas arenosclerae TaxID=1633495 RepID=UPI000784F104|nr:fructose PTS transporter subunit IIA [Endozoicomonas arenosclerae]
MLKQENVILDVSASSKEALFESISKVALETGVVSDAAAFVEGLKARETVSSTGFMDGFAIPHCKSTAVKNPAVFFIRLQEGIEWGLTDNTAAQYMFCLAISDSDDGSQLKVLSKLSRKLVHADFRSQLKTAASASDIVEIVNQAIS